MGYCIINGELYHSSANNVIIRRRSNRNNYYVRNSELYHHGVKGMKWGVRRTPQQLGHDVKQKVKNTAQNVKNKVSAAAKKVGNTVSKLAKDPRVRMGAMFAGGILAGALGSTVISQIATTTAFRKMIQYGQNLIEKDIQGHADELGLTIHDPYVDSYGVKHWSAYATDGSRTQVHYTQNLKTGHVQMSGGTNGYELADHEMFLPDSVIGWKPNKYNYDGLLD